MKRSPGINELVAINLRYDGSAAALNVRAQAQLAAKLLFVGGRAVSQSSADLAKAGANVLGLRRVAVESVEAGLRFLADIRLARDSHGRWLLTDRGYETIGHDVERAKARVASVLERHFPGRLDKELLRTWFNDACVAFYGLYGTQWAAALTRQANKRPITPTTLSAAISEATQRSHLRSEFESLSGGFFAFINSRELEDIEHQWSLGQSMLAARLVAANVGPDPITAAEFRDSILLLDTNALLVAALESHRLVDSLAQLEEALRALNIALAYIEDTREEYVRAVRGRMTAMLGVVGEYSTSVLRKSGDAFLITAIDRHCTTEQDFSVFFDELLDPPSALPHGTSIVPMQDAEVEGLARQGRGDAKLKAEIEGIWVRMRGRRKSPRATEHDAALAAVAEGLSASGRKCAVLTLDRTMQEHALQRAGEHASPLWLSLDALIQVLAVDASGPEVDAAAYAPLMASIIRHQCEPVLNTYTSDDLALLLDIEERSAALPEDAVARLASLVSRARLSGKPRTDPELQLQVRRAFQSSQRDENEDLRIRVRDSDAGIRKRDEQLHLESARKRRIRQELITVRARDLRRAARRKAFFHGSLLATGAVLFALGAYFATQFLLADGSAAEAVAMFLSLGGPAVALAGTIWRSTIPRWRLAVVSAEDQASYETDALENPQTGGSSD